MTTRTFPCAPEKFQAYFAQLPSEGFTVTDDAGVTPPFSGHVEGKGVIIEFYYSPQSSILELTGVSKPWLVSWDYVWNLIASHLA